jgi:hypothetical protein
VQTDSDWPESKEGADRGHWRVAVVTTSCHSVKKVNLEAFRAGCLTTIKAQYKFRIIFLNLKVQRFLSSVSTDIILKLILSSETVPLKDTDTRFFHNPGKFLPKFTSAKIYENEGAVNLGDSEFFSVDHPMEYSILQAFDIGKAAEYSQQKLDLWYVRVYTVLPGGPIDTLMSFLHGR